MRLYKYRDFADAQSVSFDRLAEILTTGRFWCARPHTLNDPTEFIWDCDYTTSAETVPLLKQMFIKLRGKGDTEAQAMAQLAVRDGLLDSVARPVFEEMIEKCRNEIGLSCFANSNDNPVMWERYGGGGNGVCVGVDVPDQLLGEDVFRVKYLDRKIIHIDRLLAVFAEVDDGKLVHEVALLSKPEFWRIENEIRFVSMRQNVAARLPGSKIASITLGTKLSADNASRVSALATKFQIIVASRE